MLKSAVATSQRLQNTWNTNVGQCHANLKNFGFCPKGPLEEKDGGECFAPRVYIFFCAAARRQPQQVSQRTQERGQMSEIREFDNLAEIHLSFGTDTLDINFDHSDHF